MLAHIDIEGHHDIGDFVGKNSESLFCKLEEGVIFNTGLTMVIFHGDTLMRRVPNIIDRVVAAGQYNYWNSLRMDRLKLRSRKIAIIQALNRYSSFNLHNMQPAFYFLLLGWCLMKSPSFSRCCTITY